ncbi:hypothetical protein [Arthrobacter sp. UYCu723]
MAKINKTNHARRRHRRRRHGRVGHPRDGSRFHHQLILGPSTDGYRTGGGHGGPGDTAADGYTSNG